MRHPNGLSEEDRGKQITESARKAFARHQIRSRSEGRWILAKKHDDGKRWDSCYWAEVIILAGGKILVHGDIESVIFAYYGDSRDPESVLRWMGMCKDVEYYVHQKAVIGSGHKIIDTTDDDVACWQMNRRINDIREELLSDCNDPDYCDASLGRDLSKLFVEELAEMAEGLLERAKALRIELPLLEKESAEDFLTRVDTWSAVLDKTGESVTTEEELRSAQQRQDEVAKGLRDALSLLAKAIETAWCNTQMEANPRVAAYQEAIDALQGDGLEAAIEVLRDATDPKTRHSLFDCEEYGDFGTVMDARVYYAHEAMRKLCMLLDEEKAAAVSVDGQTAPSSVIT